MQTSSLICKKCNFRFTYFTLDLHILLKDFSDGWELLVGPTFKLIKCQEACALLPLPLTNTVHCTLEYVSPTCCREQQHDLPLPIFSFPQSLNLSFSPHLWTPELILIMLSFSSLQPEQGNFCCLSSLF